MPRIIQTPRVERKFFNKTFIRNKRFLIERNARARALCPLDSRARAQRELSVSSARSLSSSIKKASTPWNKKKTRERVPFARGEQIKENLMWNRSYTAPREREPKPLVRSCARVCCATRAGRSSHGSLRCVRWRVLDIFFFVLKNLIWLSKVQGCFGCRVEEWVLIFRKKKMSRVIRDCGVLLLCACCDWVERNALGGRHLYVCLWHYGKFVETSLLFPRFLDFNSGLFERWNA